jgi:hypothetical protein
MQEQNRAERTSVVQQVSPGSNFQTSMEAVEMATLYEWAGGTWPWRVLSAAPVSMQDWIRSMRNGVVYLAEGLFCDRLIEVVEKQCMSIGEHDDTRPSS